MLATLLLCSMSLICKSLRNTTNSTNTAEKSGDPAELEAEVVPRVLDQADPICHVDGDGHEEPVVNV